jgi:hypothetical protein
MEENRKREEIRKRKRGGESSYTDFFFTLDSVFNKYSTNMPKKYVPQTREEYGDFFVVKYF